MTYPSSDVDRTNLDATADSPALARADLLDLVDKFNLLRNHITVFIRGLLSATDATAARSMLVAAKSGANTDVTSLGAVTGLGNATTTDILLPGGGNVQLGNSGSSVAGVAIASNLSLSFAEGSNQALATMFRQASNGSCVIGSGVACSANANSFASSYGSSWPRAAIEVGYYGIKFYHNSPATVTVGADVTMEEQVRFVNNGLQYSRIPGYSGLYDQFMCRARCIFNVVSGTVTIGANAGNVTSITDFGVGDFGVNLTTPMPDIKYTFVGSAGNVNVGSNPYVVSEQSRSASQLRLTVFWVTNGAVDPAVVSVAIFR